MVTLQKILEFGTGADSEPVLGFSLMPSLHFFELSTAFIPTANTCTNSINIPRPSILKPLPDEGGLFHLFDHAFMNSCFGTV